MKTTFNPLSNDDLLKKVRILSLFTIIYNCIEGVISIYFGVSEASSSLVAFGADSFIETFSAMVILWHFNKPDRNETTALKLIAGLFFLLGGLALFGAGLQLYSGSHPTTTLPGIIISAISLSFMFFLYKAKMKVGTELKSETVLKDAACSLACIQLSGVLFIGSLLFQVFPTLWWVDAVAAIVIAYYVFKEGRETYLASRGEDCCGCS